MTQNTARKNSGALVPRRAAGIDGLGWWVEQYFQHAVTTSPASQQVQRRDLGLFLRYLRAEEGTDQRLAWTAPPGASLSATPPADADTRGAPGLERQDDPTHPGASQNLCHLGAHA